MTTSVTLTSHSSLAAVLPSLLGFNFALCRIGWFVNRVLFTDVIAISLYFESNGIEGQSVSVIFYALRKKTGT